MLDEFEIDETLPNAKYLEQQMGHLARMCAVYKSQSTCPTLTARNRAKARDMEQNALGLINGIKFSISFWLNRDIDLMNAETVEEKDSNEIHTNQ